MDYLDKYLKLEDYYSRVDNGTWSHPNSLRNLEIKLPICPKCRKPIDTLRYGRIRNEFSLRLSKRKYFIKKKKEEKKALKKVKNLHTAVDKMLFGNDRASNERALLHHNGWMHSILGEFQELIKNCQPHPTEYGIFFSYLSYAFTVKLLKGRLSFGNRKVDIPFAFAHSISNQKSFSYLQNARQSAPAYCFMWLFGRNYNLA